MGDPEGLFSTIPAVVSVLAGYFTGQWIRSQPVQSRTSIGLALFGSWLFNYWLGVGVDIPHQQKAVDEFLRYFYQRLGITVASSLLRTHRSAADTSLE